MSFYSEKTQKFLPITLFFVLFILNFVPAEARRRYNPEKTRSEAIFFIRSESAELSQLAGLTPLINDSMTVAKKKEMMENASEDLSDPLDFEGEYGEDWEDLEAEGDIVVSQDEFEAIWLDAVTTEEDDAYDLIAAGISKQDLLQEVMNWLGTPYHYGGHTSKGIDCSAFTQRVFMNLAGMKIPRTARTQINIGEKIPREELQFGDLIFFHTRRRPYVSHVGIYLCDDLFAHASSRYGVTVSSIKSGYYNRRFIRGARITPETVAKYAIEKKVN